MVCFAEGESKEIIINSDVDTAFINELLEVFNKMNQAQKLGDIGEMKQYWTKERSQKMTTASSKASEAENDMPIYFLTTSVTLSYEVVNQKISPDGNKATLYLQGKQISLFTKKEELYNGTIAFLKEDGEWKIDKIVWKAKQPTQALIPQKESPKRIGNSVISGTVELPITDKQGNLYIKFSPADQVFGTSKSERYSTVIKKEDITSNKVAYKIENVPVGTYTGSATWDIAEPFWEPSWGEGSCPGYPGDYAGGTHKEIVVIENQTIDNVNIKCTLYLRPSDKSDYGKE